MNTSTSTPVASADAPAFGENGAIPHRKPSILLILAIIFIPVLAAWFTLRNGYSKAVRWMAFGWMGIYLLASSGNGTTDSRVEEVITNYLLASTGKGICETVTDTKLDVISRGTAAYEYAKPEPAVLAKFTATCTYYVGGKEIKKRDEYAAYVVIQKSTGNAESVILGIEYMDRVKQRLDSLNFVEG